MGSVIASGSFRVDAQRVRCVRVNEVVDPNPCPSSETLPSPIVVQIARYDTRQAEQTMSRSLTFPVDSESIGGENRSEER